MGNNYFILIFLAHNFFIFELVQMHKAKCIT